MPIRNRASPSNTSPGSPRRSGDRAIVLLNEGKAFSALGWNDRAEVAWKNALALEPRVPEAGWNLLSLYYVQGRRALRIPWRWRLRRRSPTRAIVAVAPGARTARCRAAGARLGFSNPGADRKKASRRSPHGDRPGPGSGTQ